MAYKGAVVCDLKKGRDLGVRVGQEIPGGDCGAVAALRGGGGDGPGKRARGLSESDARAGGRRGLRELADGWGAYAGPACVAGRAGASGPGGERGSGWAAPDWAAGKEMGHRG
jgi:hypothetical protein